jgi:hypothetical protein
MEVSSIAVLSDLCIYATSVKSQLHSSNGKEHHGFTPSTSASNSYTSLYSIPPYIPYLGGLVTQTLVVITFTSDKTLVWVAYVRGSLRGTEQWEWGKASSIIISTIYGTCFHGLLIVLITFSKGSQRKYVYVEVLTCSGLFASSCR